MPTALKLFFDGGCRPNPGRMETAVVVRGVFHHHPDLGFGTNGDAEWLALHHALAVAADLGARDIVLLGDSRMVVGQATDTARCRTPDLAAHLAAFRAATVRFAHVRVRYVRRGQNLAGIALDAHARR